MLLSDGKVINFTRDIIIFEGYEYTIINFTRAKTLRILLQKMTIKDAIKVCDKAFTFYAPIARQMARKQHSEGRTMRNRNAKCGIYGAYKGLIIQIHNEQLRLSFEKRMEAQNENSEQTM